MGFPKKETYKLQCEWGQCRQTYEDMEEFYKHLDEHFWTDIAAVQMESGFVCQWCECNFVTTNGHDLIRHLYFHGFHTKVKWLGFLKHEEEKAGECQINQNRNIIPELPDGFKCCWEDCFIVVDIPDKYYEHVREHAAIADPETLENGKKGFKCCWEGCNYEYAFGDKFASLGRHKLRGHLTTHTQERCYACPWCGNLYVNKTKLIDHYTRQINVENHSFQCTHCSRTFASERILKDHMRHHVNHYQCPKCAMTCPNPSALKHHIRYKHSTERPYACEFCEYRSKEPHDLQTHMQFHQSDLSYHCQVADCDYVVRSIQNLRYHYRVKHGSGDGKHYACHLCDKKYGTGYQLTHHLRKVHNFQWPPGHCRFRYKECEDGLFRLQIFRYESIELTKQITLEASTTDAETDSTNEASSSAHIRPSGNTTIVQRMNVERKKKGAATRRNTSNPTRNVAKISRNVRKAPVVGTRKSSLRTKQRNGKIDIKNSKKVAKRTTSSSSPRPSTSGTGDFDRDLPDLYINSECLEAADTLCTMKSNSAKKRKATPSKHTDIEEELTGASDKNLLKETSHERSSKSNSAFQAVTTRSGSRKKPAPPRGRPIKARKQLLMTPKDNPAKKITMDKFEQIRECCVELIPLENPVFPNHNELYSNAVAKPEEIAESPSCSTSAGISGSVVATLTRVQPVRQADLLSDENSPPMGYFSTEDREAEECFPTAPVTSARSPLLLELDSGACAIQGDASAPVTLESTHGKQFCDLQPPEFVELQNALPENPEFIPAVPTSPNKTRHSGNEPLEGESLPLEKFKNDEGKLVEVNSSEIVTDEEGNRTVITVGGEEYYLVSGTDTESGSTVYCLVELSEFAEEK